MADYDLVSIDDNALNSLLGNPEALMSLPPVKIAADQLRELNGCGRCQAAKQQKRAEILNTLKVGLRMLSGQPLAKLKMIMNTKKLRMIIRESNGKLVSWTL